MSEKRPDLCQAADGSPREPKRLLCNKGIHDRARHVVKRKDKSGWFCTGCASAKSKERAAIKAQKMADGTWLPLDVYRQQKGAQ